MSGIHLVLKAIKELTGDPEEKDLGPKIPTNKATQACHKRHQHLIDELWPRLKKAEKEFEYMKELLDKRMKDWGDEMRELQPELKNASFFNIDRNSMFVRIPKDEMPKGNSPDWVKEYIEDDPENPKA